MKYHHSKKSKTSFKETIDNITAALQLEDFGILTKIDLMETFKKKQDINFRNYKIPGACNHTFALRALEIEPTIGVLLPCSIAVKESENEEVIVSSINPMETVAKKSARKELAHEVSMRLKLCS